MKGERRQIALSDILIVSPYNAQVSISPPHAESAHWHGRQVSGPGSSGRDLFDGDILA
jgi:hypothetical protein